MRTNGTFCLRDILVPQAKSKIKAGEGLEKGYYRFFTSSNIQSKFINTAMYYEAALIFGTGGNASIHYCDEPFSTSTDCVVFYAKDKQILKTIYLYLSSNMQILESGFKGAGLRHISKEYIMNIQVPKMSAKEQIQIAEIFDCIIKVIKKRKLQLSTLDLLVKSRFIEMFGDPVSNINGWNTVELREVTSKIGSGATPKGGKESYKMKGVTFIRSMNVHDGRFEYKDLAYITDVQANKLNIVSVEENDVFINITGASVARSCIVPSEILPARVNQHVAIIRCVTERFHPIFANNMFRNDRFKGKLLAIGESGGATRQAITKQQLEMLTVILPPLALQTQFATFVTQVDKSKFVHLLNQYLNDIAHFLVMFALIVYYKSKFKMF
ncbi:MAG: restriction endonuclease subunit S [Oscillospiraceae bacterium]